MSARFLLLQILVYMKTPTLHSLSGFRWKSNLPSVLCLSKPFHHTSWPRPVHVQILLLSRQYYNTKTTTDSLFSWNTRWCKPASDLHVWKKGTEFLRNFLLIYVGKIISDFDKSILLIYLSTKVFVIPTQENTEAIFFFLIENQYLSWVIPE